MKTKKLGLCTMALLLANNVFALEEEIKSNSRHVPATAVAVDSHDMLEKPVVPPAGALPQGVTLPLVVMPVMPPAGGPPGGGMTITIGNGAYPLHDQPGAYPPGSAPAPVGGAAGGAAEIIETIGGVIGGIL
ncbi:MAG: hypothetical protein JSR85_02375 [Proteobacteria bacterium]|nr:hypothetical protein [Pseudomonadota bacterium]